VVQLTSPDFSASQGEPQTTIGLIRAGATSTAVTVTYATSDGTAHAGTNYQATSGTVTFAAGETSKTFSVPLKDDGAVGGSLRLGVRLTSPTGGASLGSPATANLWLLENR
jgi:hypothetical protein